MATPALTKEDTLLIIACIDRAIKGDKITQSRTASPLMKEAITQQVTHYEKLKQKLLGV